MTPRFCIGVASNDQKILESNLLASDLVISGAAPVKIVRNASPMAVAYNKILDETDADYVILAHQDVYFPPRWEMRLNAAIAQVAKQDPNWGLIGATGISEHGEHVGEVWSSSQGSVIGSPVSQPTPAQSFDELVVVLNRKSGLRFDETLPGFHLFGTDIVQLAHAKGIGAYICNLPLVHNDRFHQTLGKDFWKAFGFIRRKWAGALPLRTTVLPISKAGFSQYAYRLRSKFSQNLRAKVAVDCTGDPKIYSKSCGWEDWASTRDC